MNYSHPKHSIFAIQVFDQVLLYAPLHDLAALVNRTAALRLRDSLLRGKNGNAGRLGEIASILNGEGKPAPRPKQGDLAPEFLGLLPTRSCNLACRYCGFLTAGESPKVMDLKLARDAVNWYMDWVSRTGKQRAEIHFFGGEPFCAGEVLDLTVHLARKRSREAGCALHFEAATNGVYSEERCRWAADNLHTIVLSLDGPADIQDQHRIYKDGRSSFPVVTRSAKILSAGAADLFFRSCVTRQTVDRMPEIAAWFCQNFSPQGVSFEPVQPTAQSEAAQLEPPDPWKFACNFVRAARILESHGIEAIYSSADVNTRRVSFCPAGQDVVIVSPDGTVSACYLLQRDWEVKGLDLRLGRMENGSVHLDADAVASARSLNVWNKPSCARCFCKWHCAGGCHVNHTPANLPGAHDRLCIQTRAITLRNILKAMGRDDVAHDWIEDREAMVKSVLQVSDLLIEGESPA